MLTDIEAGFIGIRELADKLAISVRSIWRIIKRGELSVVKVGRRSLISKAEASKWIAGKEAPTPPENTPNIARRFQ